MSTQQKSIEPDIQRNLVVLEQRIQAACAALGRDPGSVTLIGVSKTKPLRYVRQAAALGIQHLGENYLDEAIDKIRASEDLDLTWHYIGRIQSNKTKDIAENFHWVHTVDRIKVARRLHNQCPPGKRLNVLLQINIDNDPAKAGVVAADAWPLLREILALTNLRPRGLMTILAQKADPGASYDLMAQLFSTLRDRLDDEVASHWDSLSMGMTGDLEQAIAAGATHVRIGTALFGARDT
jgi:pyridoxal phosphate enzyme (YggS family)